MTIFIVEVAWISGSSSGYTLPQATEGDFPGREWPQRNGVLGSLSVVGNLLAADKGYFCINKSFEEGYCIYIYK